MEHNSLADDLRYTEFSKAFDEINHSIPTGNLHAIGIKNHLLPFF